MIWLYLPLNCRFPIKLNRALVPQLTCRLSPHGQSRIVVASSFIKDTSCAQHLVYTELTPAKHKPQPPKLLLTVVSYLQP